MARRWGQGLVAALEVDLVEERRGAVAMLAVVAEMLAEAVEVEVTLAADWVAGWCI